MAKTNFTKVEDALIEGLRKMTVAQFLELADEASKTKKNPSETKAQTSLQRSLIASLKIELKYLHKSDPDLYLKLKIDVADLKRFIENPGTLTPAEWEQIKKLKENIEAYKKKMATINPLPSNEDLVEKERQKHINKRFNTKDDWLPLH